MKMTLKALSCLAVLATLTACGDTVVHEHPVVVQPQPVIVAP